MMGRMSLSDADRERQTAFRRRIWDRDAAGYDRQIGMCERRILGAEHRAWAAAQAEGEVLEVAIGTGLNLPLYAENTRITGIDISPEMLAIARARAADLGLDVVLEEGDAHRLALADASFDTVVCTLSLCNIPDTDLALAEMHRVLRPGGRLVLVDHVRSTSRPLLWLQKLIEIGSLRFLGDHMTRRPADQVPAHGFRITHQERFRAGIVERLVAVKDA